MSFINQPTQFLPQTGSNRMTEKQCWLGQRSLKDKEETKERKKNPKPIETRKQAKRKQNRKRRKRFNRMMLKIPRCCCCQGCLPLCAQRVMLHLCNPCRRETSFEGSPPQSISTKTRNPLQSAILYRPFHGERQAYHPFPTTGCDQLKHIDTSAT
jgi:hypothetical protein